MPLWVDDPKYDSEDQLLEGISSALADYANEYDAYVKRNLERMPSDLVRFDSMPRVVLMPGLGAVCVGGNVHEAEVVRDITDETLRAKVMIAETGDYEGLGEKQLFDMEYFSLQHRKLDPEDELVLRDTVALVTGAVGAIGSGICEELLKHGAHVAVTDLPGEGLESFEKELKSSFGNRVMTSPLDVTDAGSVSGAFDRVIGMWGGVDLIVANAGIAHVSSLAEMDPDEFRKLESVNVEGTLHLLSEASRRFRTQGTGGDIVLISTKNVFAPGAQFGAYSATKAAAHQLARIASLELAPLGVRVNMVSPDAVFSHSERKSGLWSEVGPSRMRARGLDEKGLEEYYQNRNLLKAKITATHVAKAVLFFATRQTPTTGATIPVDGGLPDSTPR
jgi:NAD(P)-dependent dehydrogenase (short-subunit alcohol dehydrogenase family)